MQNFEKIQSRSTVVSNIYDQMKRSILRGELEAGTRITEMSLTEAFGVSRTPVREAISRLVAQGFINEEGNQKVVANISVSMAEIIGIRAVLEGYAARLAAENATAEDLQKIQKISQSNHIFRDSKTLSERASVNDSFHEAIAHASHNGLLMKMISDLFEYMFTEELLSHYSATDADQHADQHHSIIAALVGRDPEAADVAMRTHVLAVGGSIRQAIDKLQSSAQPSESGS